ncbi:chemotaxis protein CheA [uncultured Sphingomonas sp.]|uniref:chemotaxis protein CheA n=1 Tax=uncultured Sphingomonas sp. TaxID=158754 RepID=UPI0025840798|nr:chemotaxis protein CheA [uncultured Sphingomonas sp.]
MSADDPIAAFRVEAGEVLDQVEQGLLDLGHDLGNADLVNAVFRGLHTLKGSGAMFGFDALAGFTHHCETAFDRVRKGQVPATAGLVAVILSAQDHMRALVDGDAPKAEGDAILTRLQAAIDEASGTAPATPAAAVRKGWKVAFKLPVDAMANGTNPLMLLDELRELGDTTVVARTDAIPPLSQLVPTECHVGWDVTLIGDIKRDDIEDVFIFVMDDMELAIEPLEVEAEAEATVEVPAAVEEPAVSTVTAAGDNPAARSTAKAEESVRVPAGRLDALMDRVGELVIAQSRLSQLADRGQDLVLRSVSEEIERLAGELRETMMVLRMVPVGSLFSRFRRLIHDLSRDTGKTIEFETEGEATEVDKTVIERLFDPMVHLIRNSCDHGLETPEDRAAAGKPAAGTVRLAAHQAGGEVVITIRDDGRGINRARVRAKAEANGLIQPDQPLSDHELLQMIFAPGFSTAAAVTNLSGRGVGMDVVKRTIEGLRGSIDVQSTEGEGSLIALRIPLTLAIIDGLLVRVGTGRYVIPLTAVEECIELSLEDDLRHRGRSLITLREKLVPFLRLRELFATDTRPDPFQKIVVVSTPQGRVGLVVDQIIGNHQTVIKPMSALHRDAATFAGATILGDGEVALILDIAQLIALGQPHEETLRAAG